MMKVSALLVLLAWGDNVVLEGALAFAPSTSFSKSSSSTMTTFTNKVSPPPSPSSCSALFVGMTHSAAVAMEVEEGDTAALIMTRAANCANEAYCSLEDLQSNLDAVLHVQSECVAHASALYKNPVCDNVQVAAEVVGKLRHKIQEAKRLAPLKVSVNLINGLAAALIVALLVSGVVLHPHVPVDSVATTTMAMSSSSTASTTNGMTVTPFLTQEIWWAIRDGYLPTLMAEYFQHGGLMVDPTYDDLVSVQLTPQEWWWSARDGYLPTLLEHYTKSGGLLVDASYSSHDYDGTGTTTTTTTVLSLEPREVMWSIRDGYLGQAASHVFRNGGL